MIGQDLSHYRILDRLGAGGMGEVYLAEDTNLGRQVALKLFSAEFANNEARVQRFEREARAASTLNHPNIITIHEIGQVNGVHFIATEYINGKTLRQQISNGRIEPREALEIALQVASALTAAHQVGIVHRDIKPENIMIRPDGYVKVLDFGLAKFIERASPSSNSETTSGATTIFKDDSGKSGVLIGTPKYMSPEQVRGLKLDARTDIFSLGIVIYEMITGSTPFQGATVSDLIVAILNREPPLLISHSIEGVPTELERIISKSLCKDREERYQNTKELLTDLKSLKHRMEFEAELERSGQLIILSSDKTPTKEAIPRSELRFNDTVPAATTVEYVVKGIGQKNRGLLAILAALILIGSSLGYYSLHRETIVPVPTTETHSLAILPFRNLRPDAETDFLGFTLSDAIITKLSYIQVLAVRPSYTVEKYRNQAIDPKRVAQELNVNTMLVGSYLKDDDDLRINAQ
ncbi:MAG: serine/threonine-protein kinase, partial [Acidobacteriota bacterium]